MDENMYGRLLGPQKLYKREFILLKLVELITGKVGNIGKKVLQWLKDFDWKINDFDDEQLWNFRVLYAYDKKTFSSQLILNFNEINHTSENEMRILL